MVEKGSVHFPPLLFTTLSQRRARALPCRKERRFRNLGDYAKKKSLRGEEILSDSGCFKLHTCTTTNITEFPPRSPLANLISHAMLDYEKPKLTSRFPLDHVMSRCQQLHPPSLDHNNRQPHRSTRTPSQD